MTILNRLYLNAGGGIRTHGPLRVSGFQDRCIRPTMRPLLKVRDILFHPGQPLAWHFPEAGVGLVGQKLVYAVYTLLYGLKLNPPRVIPHL